MADPFTVDVKEDLTSAEGALVMVKQVLSFTTQQDFS